MDPYNYNNDSSYPMFIGKTETLPTSEVHHETSIVNNDTYSISPNPVIGKIINNSFSTQVNYNTYL